MSSIIQSHIHLSPTLGGSPELAPTYKWKVRDRQELPVVKFELTETLDNYVYAHVVGNDTPVSRTNYEYIVKIIGDDAHDVLYYRNLITSMNGKECYLVDNFHPVDGLDHTNYVSRVLVGVGTFTVDVISLEFFWVPITLYSLENPS